MDEKGVYAIARSLWESDAFMNQKFTQREAWLWLIGAAVWKQARVNLDGKRVTLERGEFAFSVRFLAKKWKWSKSSVSRFIILIEKRDMIRDVSRDGVSVFSICKYNEFQVVGLPSSVSDGTQSGTDVGQARDTRGTKKKHDKHDKHENVEEGAPVGAAASSKPVLPDWLPKKPWSDYSEMRRKARKPMTVRAQEIILSKLDRWRMSGHDPGEILDNSTANTWTDVYEPKANRNGQRNRSPHETVFDVASAMCAEILSGGQGPQGSGANEVEIPLLPAGSDRGANPGRH